MGLLINSLYFIAPSNFILITILIYLFILTRIALELFLKVFIILAAFLSLGTEDDTKNVLEITVSSSTVSYSWVNDTWPWQFIPIHFKILF